MTTEEKTNRIVNFEIRMKEYISMIDEYLNICLSVPIGKQQVVADAMAYSVGAGGKRIRPVLTLEFCRISGGQPETALPFAAAVEMIHSYSLIHDDLPCMDNDDFRRGKPSCHKAYGEANALLAGDGLLTMAFYMLTQAELPPEQIVQAAEVLSNYAGIVGMIGGQVIDLQSEGQAIDEDTLNATYDLKTAALLKAACELGCIAASAGMQKRQTARDYAKNLGFAFQIVDDILDVEGDAQKLGKPTGSDADNDKRTYIALFGMAQAKKRAEEYSEAALNCLRDFDDCDFLKELTHRLAVRNH